MVRSPAGRGARLTPADRRSQILAAARRILENAGIDEVSVDTVAAEAGVSPGLLFHYFGSQRKFRQAVLQCASEELLSHVRPDPALSPAEQITGGIATFVGFVARYPSIYQAVTKLNSGRDTRELHRSARATLAGWISEGLAASGIPQTPAVTLTVSGWLAYMEEVVLSWLAQPTVSRAELLDLCERTLYQVLRTALGLEESGPEWQALLARVRTRPEEPASP